MRFFQIALLLLLLAASNAAAQSVRPLDGVTPIVMRPPEQCVGVVRPESAGRGQTPGYEPVRPQQHISPPAALTNSMRPGDTITIRVIYSLTGTVDSVNIIGARDERAAADAADFIRGKLELIRHSPASYNGCPVRGLDESRLSRRPAGGLDIASVLPAGALATAPVVQLPVDRCVDVVRPAGAGRERVPGYVDVTPHIVVMPDWELVKKLGRGDTLTIRIIYSLTGTVDSVTILGIKDSKAASKGAAQIRKVLERNRYSPATYNGCAVRGIHEYKADAGPDGYPQRRPLQRSWKNP